MTKDDTKDSRLLRFGVIEPSYQFRRTNGEPGKEWDAEPDLSADYTPVDWAVFLQQDISGALVMFDPTYRCNMRCPFCALPVTTRTFADSRHVRTVLQSLALSGAETLVLTGGEPGVVPDFPDIVATAAQLGLRVSVLTNGTWATNPATVRRIVECGIDEIVFSLKGADKRTSERLAGRRFFDRQMHALAIFAEMSGGSLRRLVVNHVIAGDSLGAFIVNEQLDESLAKATVLLSLVEPYTPEMVELVPSPHRLREDLRSLLSRWQARCMKVQVEGVPLCLLGHHIGLSRDAGRSCDHRPRVLIKPRGLADHVLYYRGYQRRMQFTQMGPCRGCSVRTSCPGVHKKYAEDWARDALVPLGEFARARLRKLA